MMGRYEEAYTEFNEQRWNALQPYISLRDWSFFLRAATISHQAL